MKTDIQILNKLVQIAESHKLQTESWIYYFPMRVRVYYTIYEHTEDLIVSVSDYQTTKQIDEFRAKCRRMQTNKLNLLNEYNR